MSRITEDEKSFLLKKVTIMLIISIFLTCTFVLGLILGFSFNEPNKPPSSSNIYHPGFIAGLIFTSISFIINFFVLGIIIITNNWKNDEINYLKRATFGHVLIFIILGPIASLIFCIKSMNIYKSIDIDRSIDDFFPEDIKKSNSNQKDNHDREDNRN